MSVILGLDPGTDETGLVTYDCLKRVVIKREIVENGELLKELKKPKQEFMGAGYDVSACEWVEMMGMPVGKTTFETVHWIGRFYEAAHHYRVTRREVKLCICGSMKAKDPNIRQSIVDRFPPTGGGKKPQFGTSKEPGPLYGVTRHKMSALAVAITFAETKLITRSA